MTRHHRAALLSFLALGFGIMIWLGLRFPNGSHAILIWYFALAALLPLPAFALLSQFRSRWPISILLAMYLAFLAHAYVMLVLATKAKATTPFITTSAVVATLVLFWTCLGHRMAVLTVYRCGLYLGYATCLGALMAGNVQGTTILLGLLAMGQILEWEATGAREPRLWSGAVVLFGFVVPIAMLLSLRIGHMTAIPLMASLLIGTFAAVSLILSAEEQERDNPETDQHDA